MIYYREWKKDTNILICHESRWRFLQRTGKKEWIAAWNNAKRGKVGTWLGRKHSDESRLKISKIKKESPTTPRGSTNKAYVDGRSKENRKERSRFHQTVEYRLFREHVLKRDNHMCKHCSSTKNLQIHHIQPYKYFPNLRLDERNGVTLCKSCHIKTDSFGRKKEYEIIRTSKKVS